MKMMEDAQGKKAPISKLADTVAGYFVPTVMTIAVVASIIWMLLGHDITFVLTIFCICARHCMPVCAWTCNSDSDHGRNRTWGQTTVF